MQKERCGASVESGSKGARVERVSGLKALLHRILNYSATMSESSRSSQSAQPAKPAQPAPPASDPSEPSEAVTVPMDSDLATLTHSIIEWRRMKEVYDKNRQDIREAGTKIKALEEIILRIMRDNRIGALDLKNSGGRVLFKKSKRQAGMGRKTMEKLIAEHLESADKAQALMQYVQDHRDVVIKESIMYEKTS